MSREKYFKVLIELWPFKFLSRSALVWSLKRRSLCLPNAFGCNKLQLSAINSMNFIFPFSIALHHRKHFKFTVNIITISDVFCERLQHGKMDLSTIVYRSINLNPLKYFMINFQSTCKTLKPTVTQWTISRNLNLTQKRKLFDETASANLLIVYFTELCCSLCWYPLESRNLIKLKRTMLFFLY